jgi:hypothetical protein
LPKKPTTSSSVTVSRPLENPFTPETVVIECYPMEKPMKPDQKKDRKKDEKKKGKVKTKLTAKELTEGELDKVQGGIAKSGKPL